MGPENVGKLLQLSRCSRAQSMARPRRIEFTMSSADSTKVIELRQVRLRIERMLEDAGTQLFLPVEGNELKIRIQGIVTRHSESGVPESTLHHVSP